MHQTHSKYLFFCTFTNLYKVHYFTLTGAVLTPYIWHLTAINATHLRIYYGIPWNIAPLQYTVTKVSNRYIVINNNIVLLVAYQATYYARYNIPYISPTLFPQFAAEDYNKLP